MTTSQSKGLSAAANRRRPTTGTSRHSPDPGVYTSPAALATAKKGVAKRKAAARKRRGGKS